MDKNESEVFNEKNEEYFSGSITLFKDIEILIEGDLNENEKLEDNIIKEIALYLYPYVKDICIETFIMKHDTKMKNIKDYL